MRAPPSRPLAAALLGTLLPLAAAAAIKDSAHDLSAGSAAVVRSTDSEICKFCHAPHRAQSTQLLWSHTQTSQAAFNWGGQTTTLAGTNLPTSLRAASKACLGCHDGSIALGDVRNAGGGVAGVLNVPDVAVANHTVLGGRMVSGNVNLVGAGGNLSGSHPVGVPYAGQSGYNGINSAVPAAKVNDQTGSYWTVKTAGCSNNTGVCTSAIAAGTNGAVIQLYDNVPGTKVNVGLECPSCHEPHNAFGFAWLMRVDAQTTDGLCRSCHNN